MLRDNISSASDPEKTSEVDFTSEDVEILYRLITQESYNKLSTHQNALIVIQKKLFEYLTSILSTASSAKIELGAHRRILAGQMDMLIHTKLLGDQFDPLKLKAIKADILQNGKALRLKITPEGRDDFLSTLIRINDKAQTEVPLEKNVPDKIKTGISASERNSTIYSAHIFQSSPAVHLNNLGLEKLKTKEFDAAVSFFEQAILAEREMAAECKSPVNDSNIAIYQKNIAYAFHRTGIHLEKKGDFRTASDQYQKAISALKAMPKALMTKKEITQMNDYYRNLACALNFAAMDFFYAQQIGEASIFHKNAISQLSHIDADFFTEEDEKIRSLYRRNLVYVLTEQGHTFFYQHNFDKAAENYQAAIQTIHEIEPQCKIIQDEAMQATCERNVKIALDEKIKLKKNLNSFFKRKELPSQPDKLPAAEEKILSKKRRIR